MTPFERIKTPQAHKAIAGSEQLHCIDGQTLLAIASPISIHAGTTYCEESVFSCHLLPVTVLIPQAK